MEPLLRTFWFVAIPSSLIFIIQTIMTFIGSDTSDGLNADFDGDMSGTEAPFQLFTLRNLINFLLGFSWAGISFYSSIENKPLLIFASFIIGVLFILLFFLIINQIQKLAENNSFNLASTLAKTADVYLSIPGNKSGKGKIMISINGSFHELEAMTENNTIPTGAKVKIVKIISDSVLLVETI